MITDRPMKELLQNLVRLQAIELNQVKETEAVVAELRGKVPAPVLAHYDRLIARGKKGIVPVQNQVCAGCHMRLPIGTITTLMQARDIQLCDCGRYLYLPEPTAEAATPVAEPKKKVKRARKRSAAAVA